MSIHGQQQELSDLAYEEDYGISELKILSLRYLDSSDINLSSHQHPQVSLSKNTLRLLRNWLTEAPGSASNILWLSGLPLTFTTEDIIALCDGYCLLVASFSFSSRKGSSQAQHMILSLALQISSNIPSLRPIIGRTAFRYPDIFWNGLYDRLEAFVFNPFRHYALANEGDLPLVLMIDGLELYHDVDIQRTLITSIEAVATTCSIPLRFLLTTRKSSREHGLPLRPGTHIHVHNGTPASPLLKLQSALRLDTSHQSNLRAHHGFPQLLQTQGSIHEAESYARSLIMLGHGIPLWQPRCFQRVHPDYIRQGPQIGDIMYITAAGGYEFLGNIFRGPDEPINDGMRMQGRYSPLNLDPSEVTRVENFFKPGTIITSGGITVSKQSDSPLSANFKTSANEGGILVLPEGASREDIKSTEFLHKYVRTWAPYWYIRQFIPNGSIFLVTGCDKATDYACAAFRSDLSWIGTRELDINYVSREDNEHPWHNQGRAIAHSYRRSLSKSEAVSTLTNSPKQPHLCVFIRGMRIALSSAVWVGYHHPEVARNLVTYTNVLHKPPPVGRAVESLLVRIRCRPGEEDALKRVSANNNIFHPIFVIAPELFQQYPRASVVVVNDSDWGMLTREGHGDWFHMKALIEKLYRYFAVVEDEGIVYLSRKAIDHNDAEQTPRTSAMPHIFRRNSGSAKLIPVSKFVHDLGEVPDSDD